MNLPDFLTQNEFGGIRVTGTRIGLETLLDFYTYGYSAEMIWAEYPTLTLATIHKVIAFYLENKEDVDAYIARVDAKAEELRAKSPKGPSLTELRRRLETMHRLATK